MGENEKEYLYKQQLHDAATGIGPDELSKYV